MMNFGEAMHCLALQIALWPPERNLWLRWAKYAKDVLIHFQMLDCHAVTKVMKDSTELESEKAENNKSNPEQSQFLYWEAIGILMYFIIGTRPVLAFAVEKLPHFCETVEAVHWNAVERVFWYV